MNESTGTYRFVTGFINLSICPIIFIGSWACLLKTYRLPTDRQRIVLPQNVSRQTQVNFNETFKNLENNKGAEEKPHFPRNLSD